MPTPQRILAHYWKNHFVGDVRGRDDSDCRAFRDQVSDSSVRDDDPIGIVARPRVPENLRGSASRANPRDSPVAIFLTPFDDNGIEW
jgi:hypothetical protein